MKWLGGLRKSLLEDGVDTSSLHRLKGRLKSTRRRNPLRVTKYMKPPQEILELKIIRQRGNSIMYASPFLPVFQP